MVPLAPGAQTSPRDKAIASAVRMLRPKVGQIVDRHGVDAMAQALLDSLMRLARTHGCEKTAAASLRELAMVLDPPAGSA